LKLKQSKKAGIDDFIPAIVAIIVFTTIFSFFFWYNSNYPQIVQRQTDLITDKIKADQILLDYLNYPLDTCTSFQFPTPETKELFKNINLEKTTNADLISLFMSGDPKQGQYDSDYLWPGEQSRMSLLPTLFNKGNYDKYIIYWARCSADYFYVKNYENYIIRVVYGNNSFFDSGSWMPGTLYSTSIDIPTKSEKYPFVEVHLFKKA